jgi:hypothetical protein
MLWHKQFKVSILANKVGKVLSQFHLLKKYIFALDKIIIVQPIAELAVFA